MSRNEAGGIISGWLVQLVVLMAVLAFVGHDVLAVMITSVSLDNTARDVATAAAQAYAQTRSEPAATEAGAQQAEALGAELVSLEVDALNVSVVVATRADTWWAHHVGRLEDLITPTTTVNKRWQ